MQKNTKTEAIVNYVRETSKTQKVTFSMIQRFIYMLNHAECSEAENMQLGYYSTSIQRIAIAYLCKSSDYSYTVASDENIAERLQARKRVLKIMHAKTTDADVSMREAYAAYRDTLSHNIAFSHDNKAVDLFDD
jgi:predicted glutamine amidotransferase